MPKPILLHYIVTNRCNARCAFCTIWKDTPKADAIPDDVRANLASAREAGCKFVDFTGGEPLMNPHLPEFLACAKKLGFITSVTTNCILFKEQAPAFRGLIDLLHFSIDADTAEAHDTIRDAVSYERVIESIPVALENNLIPDLLFTYTDSNIDMFEGVYRLARSHKLMVILDPVFSLDGPDTVSAATHRKARAYAKRRGVYLNTAHLTLRAQGGNSLAHSLCRASSSTIVILPDNRLALPCFHHYLHAVPIHGDLYAALQSAQRKESLQRQGKYEFCKGCHINCYFDPSYVYLRNRLALQSLISKLRYAFTKYVVYGRKVEVEDRRSGKGG
jgi:MoaA/NifB/PqqE/SkfB family radical SAM enzyme